MTVQGTGVAPSVVTFNNSTVSYTLSNSSGEIGIAGNASVSKSGSGTVTLAGVNTYTGGTTIGGGTLATTPTGSIGSGPLTLIRSGRSHFGTEPRQQPNRQQPIRDCGPDRHGDGRHCSRRLAHRQSVNEHDIRRHAREFRHADEIRSGTLELSGAATFGDQSGLSVSAGKLRINLSGPGTVGVGVTAMVSAGATLELAGSNSCACVRHESRSHHKQ